MSKYIVIKDAAKSKSGLTMTWLVYSTREDAPFGIIRWQGSWRKYVFEAYDKAYYDAECLRKIADFCEMQTREHRANNQLKRKFGYTPDAG